MPTKKKAKKKTGRPLKQIDEEQVYKLAAIFCTHEEIASVMKCSPDTLQRRFAAVIQKGREEGKASLKRAQWKKAVVDGNPTMLIWLGKQHLGQRDASRHEVSGPEDGSPVQFTLTLGRDVPHD